MADLSDPRVRRSLYWARERRRKRYRSLGLTRPAEFSLEAGDNGTVGSAITAAGAPSTSSTTHVFTIEHTGVLNGNLWSCGGGSEGSSVNALADTVQFRGLDSAFTGNRGAFDGQFQNPFASGIHTWVTAIDLPNQRVGLWIDGFRYLDLAITLTLGSGMDSHRFFAFNNYYTASSAPSSLGGVLSSAALTGGVAKSTFDVFAGLPSVF